MDPSKIEAQLLKDPKSKRKQFLAAFKRDGVKLPGGSKEAKEYIKSFDGSINPALDLGPLSGLTLSNSAEDNELCIIADKPKGDGGVEIKDLYWECIEAGKRYCEVEKKCLEKSGFTVAKSTSEADNDPESSLALVERTVEETCTRLEMVAESHQEKPKQKTMASVLRRILTGFQANSQVISSFASVVGCAQFGAGILGGISLILKAAEKYQALEGNICKALEEIQRAMLNKAFGDHIHEGRIQQQYVGLHSRLSALGVAIFALLESLIQWIFQKKIQRSVDAFLSHDTYGDEIATLVAAVRQRSQDVKDQTRILKWNALSRIDETSSQTNIALLEQRKLLLESQERQFEHNRKLEQSVKDYRAECAELLMQCQKAVAVAETWKLLTDDVKPPARLGVDRRLRSRSRSRSPAGSTNTPDTIDVDEMIQDLRYQRDLIPKDCKSIVMEMIRMTPTDEMILQELSNHIRMQAFIQVDQSCVLFLNGGLRAEESPYTVVSFLSAKLVQSLTTIRQSNQNICLLAYFCGEHHRKRVEFSQPRELVITLLLQLIDQFRGFDTPLLRKLSDCIVRESVPGLCECLGQLLGALPKQLVVFCVLDGISFWETPSDRQRGMTTILELLLGLGRDSEEKGARVKVFATTPSRCPQFGNLFESYEFFNLPMNGNSRMVRDHERGWRKSAVNSRISDLDGDYQ